MAVHATATGRRRLRSCHSSTISVAPKHSWFAELARIALDSARSAEAAAFLNVCEYCMYNVSVFAPDRKDMLGFGASLQRAEETGSTDHESKLITGGHPPQGASNNREAVVRMHERQPGRRPTGIDPANACHVSGIPPASSHSPSPPQSPSSSRGVSQAPSRIPRIPVSGVRQPHRCRPLSPHAGSTPPSAQRGQPSSCERSELATRSSDGVFGVMTLPLPPVRSMLLLLLVTKLCSCLP